ncbi:nucleotidyltransferase domain-containing protein [Streptococcus pluranimalium]|uniref:nucleotidyltransferase family protein n=1 Tax=Streptococcus pluranimalium TaxID=82348 RepID=UPI0039ED9421
MVYTIEDIKDIIKPIADKYELPAVYLFGSYARGEADEDSDIDLAVLLGDVDITGFELFALEDELREAFSIPVDFLIVEDILVGKSPIAIQMKENFIQDKVPVYETRTVGKRLLLS